MIDTELFLPLSDGDSRPDLNLSPSEIAAIVPKDCKSCRRFSSRSNVVTGSGSYTPSIMFIGLQPTKDDDLFGRPYMGERGTILDRILSRSGLSRRDVHFTYLCKCYSKESKPKMADIRVCAPYIDTEIRALKPKIVITEGPDLLKYFVKDRAANLNLLQGAVSDLPGYPGILFMPVFSLDSVYADSNYEVQIIKHIRRARRAISEPNAAKIPTSYVYISDEAQMDYLFNTIKDERYLSLDIETDGKDSFFDTKVVCWSICWAPGRSAYFPWLADGNTPYWSEEARSRIVAKWNQFLSDKNLILHNGKYDLKILRHDVGLNSGTYFFDTVISSNIIDETQMSLKLKNLAHTWTDMGGYDDQLETIKQKLGIKHDYSLIPRDILKTYACGDTDCTYRIYEKQKALLKENNLEFLMYGLYMPLSRIFMELEYSGVKVDLDYLRKLDAEYSEKLDFLTGEIHRLAGLKFDLNSSSQLSNVLFSILKLPVIKMNKHKESSDKHVLTKLKGKHAIIDSLLEYRSVSTLRNNFITTLLALADKNGFVHTSYQVGTQSTSRTSSSAPNLQNLPRSNKDIKKAFIARPGYKYYEFDFSQIEIRVLAQLSGDQKLIEDLNSGVDIHKAMAATVYGVPLDKVSDDMRSNSKSVSFGIIYGMHWKTLAAQKGMTLDSAKKLYNNFFNGYQGVSNWIEDVKDFAAKHKVVYTPFGRVRHLDAIDHPIDMIRSKCERCAVNSPIQSMGADIPNLALIKLLTEYPMDTYDYKFCFQIHDAVILEMREDCAAEFAPKVKHLLETAEPLVVATPVGCKAGYNLGEMSDVKI